MHLAFESGMRDREGMDDDQRAKYEHKHEQILMYHTNERLASPSARPCQGLLASAVTLREKSILTIENAT